MNWTREATETVRAKLAEGWSRTMIAKVLGTTRSAVSGKASRLGIKGGMEKIETAKQRGDAWTDEQNDTFRRMWNAGESVEAIAEATGRTVRAMYDRRSALGLKPRPRKAPNKRFHPPSAPPVTPETKAMTPLERVESGFGVVSSNPVCLADHKDGCRWPLGPRDTVKYCNNPVRGIGHYGHLYCEGHYSRLIDTTPPKRGSA